MESDLISTFRGESERGTLVSSFMAPDRCGTSPGSMSTATVVVVEDERVVAKDLCIQLAQLGVEVVGTASSAEMAIRLVEQCPPDLVLMDIHLKGAMDGI